MAHPPGPADAVLRPATEGDLAVIGALVDEVLPVPGAPHAQSMWARDLGSGPRGISASALSVIESGGGSVISCMAMLSRTWMYAGVPLRVGIPELVATAPAYRHRGLIRAQFEWHHARAEARHDLFAVEGLLNFYGRFGYRAAIDTEYARAGRGQAGRPRRAEPSFRRATVADAPALARLSAASGAPRLVTARRTAADWKLEIGGRSRDSSVRAEVAMLVEGGRAIGYVAHEARLVGDTLRVWDVALEAGRSWLAATPAILRHLHGRAAALAAGGARPGVEIYLEQSHPLFAVAGDELPQSQPPIAWYVRIADLPRFMEKIAPAVERHLAGSLAAGHSGVLRLSFVHDGLELVLDRGRLIRAGHWNPLENPDDADAVFPDGTFLQLLFGRRTAGELRAAHPDCWTWGRSAVLLDALFPKTPSHVWAML